MPSITKRRAKQSKVEYNGKENTMELEKMLVTPAQLVTELLSYRNGKQIMKDYDLLLATVHLQ